MTGISAGGGLSYIYSPWDGSSLKLGYINATSNYTVKQTDFFVDCTGGTFTVSWPTAAAISGKQFCIKNSGTGVITIDANGSETIDGALTFLLATQYEAILVASDGANWKVI